jgi:uncharacterized repeat protein (TIGR01451 family)
MLDVRCLKPFENPCDTFCCFPFLEFPMKHVLVSSLPLLILAACFCTVPLFAQSPNVVHTRALPERPAAAVAHTFVVSDTGDVGDANPADTLCYPCTFRAAIENAQRSAGLDMITFEKLVPVVSPLSELPVITTPVVIDGRLDSTHNVSLDGTQTSGAIGLRLAGGSSALRNMEIHHFANGGVSLEGKDSSAVQGCFVHDNGTAGVLVSSKYNLVGASLLGSANTIARNNGNGIALLAGSDYTAILWNRIGTVDGSTAAENSPNGVYINSNGNLIYRNQISGNRRNGILSESTGQPPERNTISSNFIGTTSDGLAALRNGGSGIKLLAGIADTITYNLISGNALHGLEIGTILASGASDTWIVGNRIGSDIRGNAALPNLNGINGRCTGALVRGNLISGNSSAGLLLWGGDWMIRANLIGCDSAGIAGLPNGKGGPNDAGIIARYLLPPQGSIQIGGDLVSDGNLISGNAGAGIHIEGEYLLNAAISRNIIGLAVSETAALPNVGSGIVITWGADSSVVKHNLISGNRQCGIEVRQSATNTIIRSNHIGTNAAGTVAIGNASTGILLYGVDSSVIGGTDSGDGNLISGNSGGGINIRRSSSCVVQGNRIGTEATGKNAMLNGAAGIHVWSTTGVSIGGDSAAAGNIIAGSDAAITMEETDSIHIAGNQIGLPGGRSAQSITLLRSNGNRIGGAFPSGNIILGSTGAGISLHHSDRNTISGNFIGISAAGIVDAQPLDVGISLDTSVNNVIGGNAPPLGNVIGNCAQEAISLRLSNGNLIANNAIGTDATGRNSLFNRAQGIGIHSSTNNIIGGNGIGNHIAFNSGAGVTVEGPGSNRISRNAIYENGFGIDLTGASVPVTPNDTLDADAGPNTLLNHPSITLATAGSQTRLKGVLNSAAGRFFTLEFFASPECDSSGFGQGKRYLGSHHVVTDNKGIASFAATLASPSFEGETITATTSDSSGNTSEFSRCVSVTASPRVLDLEVEISTSRDSIVLVDTLAISLRATNRGPIPATDVVLSQAIPAEVQYVSHTATQGATSLRDGVLSVALALLPKDSSIRLVVVAYVLQPGTILLRAGTYSADYDSVSSNNIAGCTVYAKRPVSAGSAPEAARLRLTGNYPNPATQRTSISFELPEAGRASLKVYNIYGALVATLVDGDFAPGRHDLQWHTGALPRGAYLAVLSAGGVVRTQRMIME